MADDDKICFELFAKIFDSFVNDQINTVSSTRISDMQANPPRCDYVELHREIQTILTQMGDDTGTPGSGQSERYRLALQVFDNGPRFEEAVKMTGIIDGSSTNLRAWARMAGRALEEQEGASETLAPALKIVIGQIEAHTSRPWLYGSVMEDEEKVREILVVIDLVLSLWDDELHSRKESSVREEIVSLLAPLKSGMGFLGTDFATKFELWMSAIKRLYRPRIGADFGTG